MKKIEKVPSVAFDDSKKETIKPKMYQHEALNPGKYNLRGKGNGHARHGSPHSHMEVQHKLRAQKPTDAPAPSISITPPLPSGMNPVVVEKEKGNPIDALLNLLPRLDDDSLTTKENGAVFKMLIQDLCDWDAYCFMAYAPEKKGEEQIPPETFMPQSWFLLSLLHARFDHEKFRVVLENLIKIREALLHQGKYNAMTMLNDILTSVIFERFDAAQDIKPFGKLLKTHNAEFSEKLLAEGLIVITSTVDMGNLVNVFIAEREKCWESPRTLPLPYLNTRLDNLGESKGKQMQDIQELIRMTKASSFASAASGKFSEFSAKIRQIPVVDLQHVDAEFEYGTKTWAKNENYIDRLRTKPEKEDPKSSTEKPSGWKVSAPSRVDQKKSPPTAKKESEPATVKPSVSISVRDQVRSIDRSGRFFRVRSHSSDKHDQSRVTIGGERDGGHPGTTPDEPTTTPAKQ